MLSMMSPGLIPALRPGRRASTSPTTTPFHVEDVDRHHPRGAAEEHERRLQPIERLLHAVGLIEHDGQHVRLRSAGRGQRNLHFAGAGPYRMDPGDALRVERLGQPHETLAPINRRRRWSAFR